ncbi:hypothetical protein [Mangrovibacterium diazotrophicum]|uniref:hypothetical protein n=1 Tax=Mangrovibacterium diazotrophicum TaxID=1261403 RepID=UPI000E770324|nr:hypothetical protein [Mangrovibacterium diazotrophicum]
MKGLHNRYHFQLDGSDHSFILFPNFFYDLIRLGGHFKQFHISEISKTLKEPAVVKNTVGFFMSAFQTKKQTP